MIVSIQVGGFYFEIESIGTVSEPRIIWDRTPPPTEERKMKAFVYVLREVINFLPVVSLTDGLLHYWQNVTPLQHETEFQNAQSDLNRLSKYSEAFLRYRASHEFMNQLIRCQNIISESIEKAFDYSSPKDKKALAREGYLYVLDTIHRGYKIGCTIQPAIRLKALQNEYGAEANFIFCFKNSDILKCEKELHKQFRHCHIERELFNLSHDDLDSIYEWMKRQ